jgi:tetratricopeptide (TPR) repeat protein
MSVVSHHDRLAAMRRAIAEQDYEHALQIGRAEMERGCDSSDLLLLLATAGQLSEGTSCSLDDVRGWLEQATQLNPDNAEAWMELGHFLDAVADQPQLAVSAFERSLEKSVAVLQTTLDGLESTSSSQDEATRERLDHLRRHASELLRTTTRET